MMHAAELKQEVLVLRLLRETKWAFWIRNVLSAWKDVPRIPGDLWENKTEKKKQLLYQTRHFISHLYLMGHSLSRDG